MNDDPKRTVISPPPGMSEALWTTLMEHKANGTLTEIESAMLSLVEKNLACKAELLEATKENARLVDENASITTQMGSLQAKNEEIKATLSKSLKEGIALAEIVTNTQENLSDCQRAHFGSVKETLKQPDDKEDDIETLADDEELTKETAKDKGIIARAIRFFIEKNKKSIQEELGDEIAQDTDLVATGIDNFSETSDDLGSTKDELEEVAALIDDLTTTNPAEPSLKYNPEDPDEYRREWVKRKPGQRQEILGSAEQEFVFADENGNVIGKDALTNPPMGINGPMKLVGCKASMTEVNFVPAKIVVTHYMVVTFKETLDPSQDLEASKLELHNRLGDNYNVSGVKTILEQQAAEKAKANVVPKQEAAQVEGSIPAEQDAKPVDVKPAVEISNEASSDIETSQIEHGSEPVAAPEGNTSSPNKHTVTKPVRKDNRKQVFVSTKVKKAFIRGCYAAPALIAFIIVYKYCIGVPIYRMVTGPGAGIILPNLSIPMSVIEHWPILVYVNKLQVLMPYFQDILLAQHYLHADETVIQVLAESNRSNTSKSYLWLYSTILDCPQAVRYFDYAPGRKGTFAKAIIGSFTGFLITDAYQGYNVIEGAIHCFCMIHARRKFFAAASVSLLKSRRTTAHNIVQLFDILLKIEASLYYLSPEERLKQRKLQMQPIVDQLIREIEKASKDPFVPKKSKLARACNYFLTYQKQLLMFMQDGSIPLHNMVAENAIRPFAIGRKNWLFCGSPLGAQAMACLLTVIETAKANGLDPYKYLTYLFEHMRGDDWKNDPEYIRRLLPWAPEVQAACAAKKKAA